jgi:hypothetical protein
MGWGGKGIALNMVDTQLKVWITVLASDVFVGLVAFTI